MSETAHRPDEFPAAAGTLVPGKITFNWIDLSMDEWATLQTWCSRIRWSSGVFSTQMNPGALVKHVAIGQITTASIVEAALRWFHAPDFDPTTPVLWDMRGQFVSASLNELETVPDRILGQTERRRPPEARSAILVDSSVSAVAMGLFEVQSQRAFATTRVFRDEDEATAWLGADG